ncbi:hypothetical protein Tco_0797161 [Tanacetum coccineum]
MAIDGAGFDWRFMVDKEVPTNIDLMAFSDSKVYNDKTCSNTYLKSFKTLKTQYDNLRIEFNKSEFNLATYKRGLASVEEQLIFYKKNEVMFCDQIVVLKRDTSFKDSEINALKSEIEKLKKEKESNQIKIDKFENASKSLDKLIGSQISDNSRKGVGFVSYNVVPPPPTGLFAPPTIDLSNSGLEEFQQPEFEGYGPKASKSVCKDTSNEVKKTPDAPLGEKLVSEKEKQTIFPTKIESVKQQEKPARKPVKYAEMYRSQKPRGNQRNWNNLKSQQLGSDFVMYNKACFVCGSFDHMQAHCNYHQRERMINGNNYTRCLKPLNTARPVNTAHPKTTVYSARPMSCFSKLAQSTVKRPYQSRTTLTNKNFNQKVNTAKEKVYTARPKAVNTARPTSTVVNAVRANQGHPQKEDQGYVDSGCSRHMKGNMSYLSDLKELMELVQNCLDCTLINSSYSTMANLEFCDKHNMVAYLQKSEGSEDEKVKFVSEASIRRHLKLEDSDGISDLPTTEIFEQLALMGFIQIFLNKKKRLLLPHQRTYIAPTLTQKLFSNMKRASKGHTGVDTPLFQTMLVYGQILQGEGSTILVESHHTPIVDPSTSQPHHSPTLRDFIRQETKVPRPSSPTQTHVADEVASTGVDDRHGGSATTVSGLDAGQGSGVRNFI